MEKKIKAPEKKQMIFIYCECVTTRNENNQQQPSRESD